MYAEWLWWFCTSVHSLPLHKRVSLLMTPIWFAAATTRTVVRACRSFLHALRILLLQNMGPILPRNVCMLDCGSRERWCVSGDTYSIALVAEKCFAGNCFLNPRFAATGLCRDQKNHGWFCCSFSKRKIARPCRYSCEVKKLSGPSTLMNIPPSDLEMWNKLTVFLLEIYTDGFHIDLILKYYCS